MKVLVCGGRGYAREQDGTMLNDTVHDGNGHPLRPLGCDGERLPTNQYNPIYEAVWRGTEEQGDVLVAAIQQALRTRRAL